MMSFLNNSRPERTPGPILNNPTLGLCERVCIQAKKVFDACLRQEHIENELVSLCDIVPCSPAPVQPYTFVSSKSTSSEGIVSNVCIAPIDESGLCFRVKCDITIPIEVIFRDACGNLYKGFSCIIIDRDVKLHLPKPSIIPFEVEATVNLIAPEGEYVNCNTFSLTCCVTSILRIVMEVDLLIPTYGYCHIPACVDFKEEACEGFFELPIFPTDTIVCKK